MRCYQSDVNLQAYVYETASQLSIREHNLNEAPYVGSHCTIQRVSLNNIRNSKYFQRQFICAATPSRSNSISSVNHAFSPSGNGKMELRLTLSLKNELKFFCLQPEAIIKIRSHS